MKQHPKYQKGITLIALVVTIVVLLILAGVSISMLTGENGIITQAQNSKEQNEIGEEKEYINLAFSAVKAGKISRGDMSEVTSAELQQEINKYTNGAIVTGTGILKITYTSGREYEVDGNGKIVSSESYDGMYSVGGLEGQIAPEDLFEYEIKDGTAKIVRIKAEYCNRGGYNPRTAGYDVTDTNCDIIYNGEKISDMLVIPYEVTINGERYTITEVNLGVIYGGGVSGHSVFFDIYWPNINKIVYPNTIKCVEMYSWLNFENYGIYEDNINYSRNSYGNVLKEIIFSNKLENIGAFAFEGTKWLESQTEGDVYIGDILYKGYVNNGTVEIKEGTKSIAGGAFYGCYNLTSITIPNSVTSIGNEAFFDCGNLTSITIPNSVTSIGERAFYWCSNLTSITIPDSVTSIENYAFGMCESLTNITIPDSVTSIEDGVFYYCNNLTSIVIPNNVTSIGDSAFDNCTGLTNITIPDNVTNIGEYAFSRCNSLTSITIPDNVTNIGEHAFSRCNSLTSITIPDSVTSVGTGAFYETKWYENQPDGNMYIGKVYYEYKGTMPENTTIIIKEGTVSIAENAFYYCEGLTNITIPDSVTSIGECAFYVCTSLMNITIPDSVISIGVAAFDYCLSLTNITIPASVISIGDYAFSRCNSLTSINIKKEENSISGAPWDAWNATINWNYTGE